MAACVFGHRQGDRLGVHCYQAAQNSGLNQAFLASLRKAASFRIRTILIYNVNEFTDRWVVSRQPTRKYKFDQLCQTLSIGHCPTKPNTLQTNGMMMERLHGRLS